MDTTPTQQLATLALNEDIITWLRRRRDLGYSLRTLAAMLADDTDGTIQVSHEVIRQWLTTAGIPITEGTP